MHKRQLLVLLPLLLTTNIYNSTRRVRQPPVLVACLIGHNPGFAFHEVVVVMRVSADPQPWRDRQHRVGRKRAVGRRAGVSRMRCASRVGQWCVMTTASLVQCCGRNATALLCMAEVSRGVNVLPLLFKMYR
jgi:hypothetical protein